jgi:hypothetical protein
VKTRIIEIYSCGACPYAAKSQFFGSESCAHPNNMNAVITNREDILTTCPLPEGQEIPDFDGDGDDDGED